MRVLDLWAVWVSLAGLSIVAGCQTAGGESGKSAAAFGIAQIPHQTEPPLEDDESSRQGARSEVADTAGEPGTDEAPLEKAGQGWRRLLAGRDQESAVRKALPLNEKSSNSDDDFDF